MRVPVLDGAARRRIAAEVSDAGTAPNHHAVDDVNHGRGDDRLEPRLRDLDEGVRLLDASRETPRGRPRTGLRNVLSILVARIALAIVSPMNAATSSPSNVNEIGIARIHRRPTRNRPPTGHGLPSSGGVGRSKAYVTVSRTVSNHRRHPATWYQRSR